MDSSNGSFDLETEEVLCQTDVKPLQELVKTFRVNQADLLHLVSYAFQMKFEQGKVSQKFTINDTKKKEILILGKLLLSENKFGQFIEWKPEDEATSSPLDSKSMEALSRKEWSMVHGTTHSKIGFKAGREDEAIEFVPDPRLAEYRRPVKLELAEIRSLLIPSKSNGKELIFILHDGTSHNPFIFERGLIENFVDAMKHYVCVRMAKDNKDLYLVTPKKILTTAPQQSIAELILPDQVNQLLGLIKDVRNDPMAVAKTGLAKLADYTATQLNGYAEQHRNPSSSNQASGSPRAVTPSRSPSRYPINSQVQTSDGLEADYTTNEEGYEVIFKPAKLDIELGPRPKTYRGQPLNQEQWLNYLDNEGRVTNFNEIKEIVFRGGVESEIRKHVWVFLLGLYDSTSTFEERKEIFKDKTFMYETMKMQWSTITEDQEERFHLFRDFKSLIEKDVARTDRCLEFFSGDSNQWTEVLRRILMTYVMYNFNLGYVQGMSDILSPILMEVQDEVLGFWLFVKFMDTIYKNFEMSQETIQQQLRDSYTLLQLVDPRFSAYLNACDAANMYFAFRWLLILFKREFSTADIFTLWEATWTVLPGPNFHLFIGLSILDQHKSTVMENKFGLSEILRHVNDLTMKIDLCETLTLAESMYLQLLQAQEKLPNNIRRILGLPEKEESTEENSSSILTPDDEPVMRGNDENVFLSESLLHSPSPSTSPTIEEQSLELNCDLGISQFL